MLDGTQDRLDGRAGGVFIEAARGEEPVEASGSLDGVRAVGGAEASPDEGPGVGERVGSVRLGGGVDEGGVNSGGFEFGAGYVGAAGATRSLGLEETGGQVAVVEQPGAFELVKGCIEVARFGGVRGEFVAELEAGMGAAGEQTQGTLFESIDGVGITRGGGRTRPVGNRPHRRSVAVAEGHAVNIRA